MIEINLTIAIQVLQFLVLAFILNRLLFRPISKVMEERQQRIASWEERTKSSHDSVRTRLQNYENQLREARVRAQEQQEQMTREIKEQEEKRLRSVSEEASRLISASQQKLRDETERLRLELHRQAEELAKLVTEKALGRKVS